MKFIMKHGKSDKDLHNLRQEIEVIFADFLLTFILKMVIGFIHGKFGLWNSNYELQL